MNKKIVLNGIELSLPRNDTSALTFFDYLEDVVSKLEEELNEDDGNFQVSINIDFSTSNSPQHQIYSNGSTKKKTKDKVARILTGSRNRAHNHVSGSVRVNLQIEDR